MTKTEMMKKYESETGKQSAIVKFMAGGQALESKDFPKIGPYEYSTDYIAWLAEQLTWRPVSEKPEKDDWVTLRRNVNGKTDDEQVWFYHLMDVKEWEGLVKTLGATHWLPIPPSY